MGSEVGEKEGEGIRKGSRAGTQTRVSRSTVCVGTRLLTPIYPEFFPAPQNRPYLLFFHAHSWSVHYLLVYIIPNIHMRNSSHHRSKIGSC